MLGKSLRYHLSMSVVPLYFFSQVAEHLHPSRRRDQSLSVETRIVMERVSQHAVGGQVCHKGIHYLRICRGSEKGFETCLSTCIASS